MKIIIHMETIFFYKWGIHKYLFNCLLVWKMEKACYTLHSQKGALSVRKINIYTGLGYPRTATRPLGKSKYQTVIFQWPLNTEQIKHYKTMLT